MRCVDIITIFIEYKKNRGINTPAVLCADLYDEFLQAVTLLELIDSAAGIYELLLAGVVRMTLATNFDFDRISLFGRTAYETCAASANNRNVMVIRLDILVHIITSPGNSLLNDYTCILFISQA